MYKPEYGFIKLNSRFKNPFSGTSCELREAT